MANSTPNYGFPISDENGYFNIELIDNGYSLMDTTLKAISDVNNATAINEPLRISAEASRVLAFNNMQHLDPILELSTARGTEADLSTRLNKDKTTNSTALTNKIQTFTYTSIADNITNIVHNLNYVSTTDTMIIQDCYSGSILNNSNFTFNVNGISIDLTLWGLKTGEQLFFTLIKNTH